MPASTEKSLVETAEESLTKDDATERELRKLKKELENRIGIPSFEEIKAGHEKATSHDKVEIDLALTTKAFELAGRPDINLYGLEVFDASKELVGDPDIGQGKPPKIMYKEIVTQETNWLGKTKDVLTDQVLVVVVLNNSDDIKENTVLTLLVDKDARSPTHVDIGPGKPGLLGLTTLDGLTQEMEVISRGYPETVFGDPKAEPADLYGPSLLGTLLISGNLTRQDYKSLYKKYRGKSLEDHWRAHDKKVEETPRTIAAISEKEQERQHTAELMQNLETDYAELAGRVAERIKILKEQKEAEKQRLLEEQATILRNDATFRMLVESFSRSGKKDETELLARLSKAFGREYEAAIQQILTEHDTNEENTGDKQGTERVTQLQIAFKELYTNKKKKKDWSLGDCELASNMVETVVESGQVQEKNRTGLMENLQKMYEQQDGYAQGYSAILDLLRSKNPGDLDKILKDIESFTSKFPKSPGASKLSSIYRHLIDTAAAESAARRAEQERQDSANRLLEELNKLL